MLMRLLKADLARGAVVAATLTTLIALAATLMSAGTSLVVDSLSATHRLSQRAKLPGLVQMHTGRIDDNTLQAIDHWAEARSDVTDHEVIKTLPVARQELSINGVNQSESYNEPAFVTSPKRFDLLLDDDGNPVDPGPGEVVLPIHYRVIKAADVGDAVTVTAGGRTTTLTVVGFARDAEMNAAMIPSKRLVVSPEDFSVLEQRLTEPEYLIEFTLTDSARPGGVIDAYKEAGLPSTGVNISASMIQFMNSLNVMLIVAVALVVAIVLAVVAILALRYATLAAIETDLAQIAVLKAIGAPLSRIRRLYVVKYLALAALGAALGYAAGAAPGRRPGDPNNPLSGSASDNPLERRGAHPHGSGPDPRSHRLHLVGSGTHRTHLGHRGPAQRHQRLPAPASATLEAVGATPPSGPGVARRARGAASLQRPAARRPDAVHPHHGAADECRHHSEQPADRHLPGGRPSRSAHRRAFRGSGPGHRGEEPIDSDPRVTRHATILRRSYKMATTAGGWETVLIDIGDHEAFPMKYLSGHGPTTDDEISLSYSQAQVTGAKEGSTVTVQTADGTRTSRSPASTRTSPTTGIPPRPPSTTVLPPCGRSSTPTSAPPSRPVPSPGSLQQEYPGDPGDRHESVRRPVLRGHRLPGPTSSPRWPASSHWGCPSSSRCCSPCSSSRGSGLRSASSWHWAPPDETLRDSTSFVSASWP